MHVRASLGQIGPTGLLFLARVNKKLRSACPISHSLPSLSLSLPTPPHHILIPCPPLSLSTPSATCVFPPLSSSITYSTSSTCPSGGTVWLNGFGLFRNQRNISEAKNGLKSISKTGKRICATADNTIFVPTMKHRWRLNASTFCSWNQEWNNWTKSRSEKCATIL